MTSLKMNPQFNRYSGVVLVASCESGTWAAEPVEGTEHFPV